jgi:hypothetical protein
MPELISSFRYDAQTAPPSNRMNITADGLILMTQLSQFQYVARSLYLICRYFLRQLPKEFQVAIDKTDFFNSMTMIYNDTRVSAGPWNLGPDDLVFPSNTAPSNDTSVNVSQDECDDTTANAVEDISLLITTPWNASSSNDSRPSFNFLAQPPATSRQEALNCYSQMSRAVGSTIPFTFHRHHYTTSIDIDLTTDPKLDGLFITLSHW